MLIQFIFLLILFQVTGDVILQIDKLIFKKKILNYTLIEHFIFSLILGLVVNTLFSLIEVFFLYYLFIYIQFYYNILKLFIFLILILHDIMHGV